MKELMIVGFNILIEVMLKDIILHGHELISSTDQIYESLEQKHYLQMII